MKTFEQIAGIEALTTLKQLPHVSGIKVNIDFGALIKTGESTVIFKGRKIKVSINPQILSTIKLKITRFFDLKQAHISNSVSITHVSQLGSVRGVPGAVGAASGVAAAVGTLLLNEDYSSYMDYISTGLTSLISGGLATFTGYHLAGFLGEFKQKDLIKKMEQIASDSFEAKFLTNIKNLLLDNMKFEIMD